MYFEYNVTQFCGFGTPMWKNETYEPWERCEKRLEFCKDYNANSNSTLCCTGEIVVGESEFCGDSDDSDFEKKCLAHLKQKYEKLCINTTTIIGPNSSGYLEINVIVFIVCIITTFSLERNRKL